MESLTVDTPLLNALNYESLLNDVDINVEEMYQVLGRDILKSTLTNDIDLYLECDDDSLLMSPTSFTDLHSEVVDELSAVSQTLNPTLRIQFSRSSSLTGNTRHRCDSCSKSFTRESLLKDHKARVHNILDLFPCPCCPYKGQCYRDFSRHFRRRHSNILTSSPDFCDVSETNVGFSLTKRSTSDAKTNDGAQMKCPTDSNGIVINLDCLTNVDHTHNEDSPLTNAKTNNDRTINCQTKENNSNGIKVQSFLNRNGDSNVHLKFLNVAIDTPAESQLDTMLTDQEDSKNQHAGGNKTSDFDPAVPENLPQMVNSLAAMPQGYTCRQSECGSRTFKTSSALNEHTKTIHGVKSFRCGHPGCTKTYAVARDLRQHVATHGTTFRCTWDGCRKMFRDKYNLDVHYRVHTGQKTRCCPLCDYACVQKTSLDWHLRTKHKDNSTI